MKDTHRCLGGKDVLEVGEWIVASNEVEDASVHAEDVHKHSSHHGEAEEGDVGEGIGQVGL